MTKIKKAKLILGLLLVSIGTFLIYIGGFFAIGPSTYFFIPGLILLVTVPESDREKAQPHGLALFGSALLFSSIFVGFIFFAMLMLGVFFAIEFALFALGGFPLSILVLRRVSSKYLWHASMAYLVSILSLSIIRDLSFGITFLDFDSFLFYCFAFVQAFSFCSILYLLTKKTRQYYSHAGIVKDLGENIC